MGTLELFREQLTNEQLERLEQEARAQVKPGLGISEKRQLEASKDAILMAWFEKEGEV